MSRRFSDFLVASSCFYSNNCSGSELSKSWRLYMQLAASRMQKLDATGRQSHTYCTRVAASRLQIVPAWPPIACKLYLRGRQSHATWIKSTGICMRLAATRVQFVCDWPPVASIFCMRLTATRVQIVCDWPPVAYIFCMRLPAAHYFSTIWQIVLTFPSKLRGCMATRF